MDKANIRKYLALAEKHVRLGEGLIATQKAIVANLISDGADATAAQRLLETFEDIQVGHIGERDRLAKELDA